MRYLDEIGFNDSWFDDQDDNLDFDLDLDLGKSGEAIMHRFEDMSLELTEKDYSNDSSTSSLSAGFDIEADFSFEEDDLDLLDKSGSKTLRFGLGE